MNGIKVDRIRYAGSVPTIGDSFAGRMLSDCIHTIHIATVVDPAVKTGRASALVDEASASELVPRDNAISVRKTETESLVLYQPWLL